MNGVDAFAAVADRPDPFADRVRYERILACRDVADWCRAQDGAGMTAADAFEAVAVYCDIAAHAMPVLGNYVGFERYVAYGGIAGWCRKAGRDAWDRCRGEQAPWFRKKEPEMSNREKKEIELGKCPFCKGKVKADMEWWHDGYGTRTLAVCYQKCENGCPVEDFAELHRETDARKGDVDELAGWLRGDWSKAAATWRRREKCPYCGEMPKFPVNAKGYLDLGCVNESHEPLNAKGCGGIVVDLVKKWDGVALPIRRRLERKAKNRRLLAVLNA